MQAGNLLNDSFHSYTYDAEGDIIAVDNGNTASYVYDALNHKVRVNDVAHSQTVEYIFDALGRITSNWVTPTYANEGHIFWDGAQIAHRAGNGWTYFVHRNWVDSDRVHTNPSGASAATYTSFPFGDGGAVTYSDNAASWDFNGFTGMDYNLESGTYHAQFRQYSDMQGRWMSPDPYDGSYDLSNPQSFNRYSYALNNPLSFIDPLGLETICNQDGCYDCDKDNTVCVNGGGGQGPPSPTPPSGPCVASGTEGCIPYPCGYPGVVCGGGGGGGNNGGGNGGTPSAPNKGIGKYHCPLFGPCYRGPALPPSCLSQTATSKAAGTTALDAIGIYPGIGNVVKAVQFGAALISAGVSIYGSARDASISATGAGLAIADKTGASIAINGVEVIPTLGNAVSVVATGFDIFGEGGLVDTYKSCVAGTHP